MFLDTIISEYLDTRGVRWKSTELGNLAKSLSNLRFVEIGTFITSVSQPVIVKWKYRTHAAPKTVRDNDSSCFAYNLRR